MAGNIGLRISLDGDSSGAKRAVDDVASSIGRLNNNAKNLPPFMGAGALPGFNSRLVPPLTPQGPYGTNMFYGGMSPGGLLPDGRRMPNTDQKIAQLTDQLEKLGETIKGVNADLQTAREAGDLKTEATLMGTLQNAKATEIQTENQLKALERERDRNNPASQFGNYLGAHLLSQVVQGAVNAGNIVIGSQKTLASGDALGASIQREKGMGSLLGGFGGTLLGALIGSLIPGGTMVGAGLGGTIGNFLGGLSGDMAEIDAAYSARYKDKLPAIDSFMQRFGGDIAGRGLRGNRDLGLSYYNQAANFSLGTGKTAEELMQAAVARGAYGNFSATQTLTGARSDLMWERFTGANLGNIQRMAGLGMRYGGDTNAVQTAYAGLTASGMGKGQFDEFLTSMQRIMEDGIENGFVRGADEIAGNMTLLSKLSGGSALWTGEQGANRLMRMNEAVSSATGLRNVEDMLSFGVAQSMLTGRNAADFGLIGTGTYVDTMQLLERGVSKELLKGQFEAVRSLEGGNTAGQIERFKQMYNLNYTGAAQVWEMSERAASGKIDWDQAERDIKKFQKDPNYQSDSQRLQDVLTRIDTSLVNMGSIKFDEMEIPRLATAAEDLHGDLLELLNRNRRTENGGGDPGAMRAAALLYDTHGEYGQKIGDLSVWMADQYNEGAFGKKGQFWTDFNYSRKNSMFSNINDYINPDSEGGSVITKGEYEEFFRKLETALNNLNEERNLNISLSSFDSGQ